MEAVSERIFLHERKLSKKEAFATLKGDTGKKKSKGTRCHHCGDFGHIRQFCKEREKNKGR